MELNLLTSCFTSEIGKREVLCEEIFKTLEQVTTSWRIRAFDSTEALLLVNGAPKWSYFEPFGRPRSH